MGTIGKKTDGAIEWTNGIRARYQAIRATAEQALQTLTKTPNDDNLEAFIKAQIRLPEADAIEQAFKLVRPRIEERVANRR